MRQETRDALVVAGVVFVFLSMPERYRRAFIESRQKPTIIDAEVVA